MKNIYKGFEAESPLTKTLLSAPTPWVPDLSRGIESLAISATEDTKTKVELLHKAIVNTSQLIHSLSSFISKSAITDHTGLTNI